VQENVNLYKKRNLKGVIFMSLAARKEGEDIDIQGFGKDDSFNALESELRKGLQSYRDGKIYTLEEAWGEIDQI